jgi:hypothetical protein
LREPDIPWQLGSLRHRPPGGSLAPQFYFTLGKNYSKI